MQTCVIFGWNDKGWKNDGNKITFLFLLFSRTSAAALYRIKQIGFTWGHVPDPCTGLNANAGHQFVITWLKRDWGASLLWQIWLGLPFSKRCLQIADDSFKAHPQRLALSERNLQWLLLKILSENGIIVSSGLRFCSMMWQIKAAPRGKVCAGK